MVGHLSAAPLTPLAPPPPIETIAIHGIRF
jgi:hypothetical protein